MVDAGDGGVPWRYGVLFGTLWARPSQPRAESLKVLNRIWSCPSQCDRLIKLRRNIGNHAKSERGER